MRCWPRPRGSSIEGASLRGRCDAEAGTAVEHRSRAWPTSGSTVDPRSSRLVSCLSLSQSRGGDSQDAEQGTAGDARWTPRPDAESSGERA